MPTPHADLRGKGWLGTHRAARPIGSRRRIVAVDARVASVATQVAHGSEWEVVGTETTTGWVEQVLASSVDAILVCAIALDPEDCLELFQNAAARDVCVGIVVVPEVRLLANLLRKAIVGNTVSASGVQRSFIHCDFAKAEPRFAGGACVQDVYTDTAAPDVVAHWVHQPYDVIYLIGHSNGPCTGVGNVTLCIRDEYVARRQSSTEASTLNVLPCFLDGPCRFDQKKVIRRSAAGVNAPLIVNLTCWGVQLSNYPFDSSTATTIGLLDGERFRTMISFVTAATICPEDYLCLYYLINAGVPIGRVVNLSNAYRVTRNLREDFVCLGAPTFSIPSSSVEGVAMLAGAAFHVLRPATSNAFEPCDLRVSLGIETEDHIVAIDSSAHLRGLLLPDGELFLTMPAHTTQVSGKLIGLTELTRSTNGASQIPALQYFEQILDWLQAVLGETGAIAPIKQRIATLIDILRRWRPQDRFRRGMIVPERWVAQPIQILEHRLASVAADVFEAYRALGSHIPVEAAASFFGLRSSQIATVRCSYCGSVVDEGTFRGSDDCTERRVGNCRRCGPIYEGLGLAKWIDLAPCVDTGTASEVTIDVLNPFPIDVPASAMLVFRSPSEQVPVAYGNIARIKAGDRATLTANWQVQKGLVPGVHRLGAVIVIGAQIEHCRRYVTIARA